MTSSYRNNLASNGLVLAGCLAVGLLVPGCVMEDFNDIGETFFAKSPAEAARDALDPYNPDLRREGVVLLSNAPFGGVEAYMKMYRDYVENDPDPLVRGAAITALLIDSTDAYERLAEDFGAEGMKGLEEELLGDPSLAPRY